MPWEIFLFFKWDQYLYSDSGFTLKQDGDFLCFLNGASKKVANYDEFVSNLDSSCLWMFRKGYNVANGNVIGNENDDSLYRSHESSIWKNGAEKKLVFNNWL